MLPLLELDVDLDVKRLHLCNYTLSIQKPMRLPDHRFRTGILQSRSFSWHYFSEIEVEKNFAGFSFRAAKIFICNFFTFPSCLNLFLDFSMFG